MLYARAILREVGNAALEQRHELVAGDVLVQAVAATLHMAHLTEDAAIRAGDALDAGDGAVGVDVEVHGRHACHVDVLRGDLTALAQLGQDVVVGDEAALAVGDGNGIELIRVALGEPRRQVAADAGANQAALVTADLVEGQRGRVGGGVDDVAVSWAGA